jgi:hypothetical protein
MARWQISLLVTGMVIAVGVFVGVNLHETADTRRDPRSSDVRPIEKGDEYVAIGDSYTGAPGTGPAAADDGCLQSITNYPHQVAEKLGLKLTDVSCGFAMTLHATVPQVLGPSRRPPQIGAVARTTDLVTISLGANDFNTFGSIVTTCTSLRAEDPDGAPCSKADAASKRPVETRMAQIEKRLVALIRLGHSVRPALASSWSGIRSSSLPVAHVNSCHSRRTTTRSRDASTCFSSSPSVPRRKRRTWSTSTSSPPPTVTTCARGIRGSPVFAQPVATRRRGIPTPRSSGSSPSSSSTGSPELQRPVASSDRIADG